MFRTVPLSIIRSFSLYTQQYIQVCSQAVSKPVWHIPLLCVQWKTPDDGQRNCPKHVEFHSKNKFEKSVHLAGFIIRIYHDAQSPERQKGNLLSLIALYLPDSLCENVTHWHDMTIHAWLKASWHAYRTAGKSNTPEFLHIYDISILMHETLQ